VVTIVGERDEFSAAGLRVRSFGGPHAQVHPDIAQVANLGYLVEESIYHPGDSFLVPEAANVDTLFVPVSGPWLKISESVDFVRAIAPRRAFALHDCLLSADGATITDSLMTRLAGCPYQRLVPGGRFDLAR
jgi:L-ascorbate metabolism protein UlaG (beta-lactamase superfamily)